MCKLCDDDAKYGHEPPGVLVDGVPCAHPGCLHHVSHPCEGCGRVAGVSKEKIKAADVKLLKSALVPKSQGGTVIEYTAELWNGRCIVLGEDEFNDLALALRISHQ